MHRKSQNNHARSTPMNRDADASEDKKSRRLAGKGSTSRDLVAEDEAQRVAAAVRTWDEDFLPAWRAAATSGSSSSGPFSAFSGFPGFGTKSPSPSSSGSTHRSPLTPSGRSSSPITEPNLPLSMSVPESLGMLSGLGLGKSSSGPGKAARRHVEEACFEGIPPSVRPRAWPALVGNRLRISVELFAMLRSRADEVRFVTATVEEEEQARAQQFLISADGAQLCDNREKAGCSFEDDGYATLGSEYENETASEDESEQRTEEAATQAENGDAKGDDLRDAQQQQQQKQQQTLLKQGCSLGASKVDLEQSKEFSLEKIDDPVNSRSERSRSGSFRDLRVDTIKTNSSVLVGRGPSKGELQESLSKLPSDSELASTLAHLKLSTRQNSNASENNTAFSSDPVPKPPAGNPPPLPPKSTKKDNELETTQESIKMSQQEKSPLSRIRIVRKTSVSSQIEQDLSRTFPRLAFFAEGGGPFRAALQEILESYALLRPGLGYVQGMSHVAAMFLLYLERDAAFQAFCNVLEDHVFFNMVRCKDSSMLIREFRLFELLLKDQLPRLSEHLKRIELQPDMFLLDWLLTIFTKALPLDVAARLWDCYLFFDTRERKERFLWRAILALLKLFEIQLLLLDFESCVHFLRNLPAFDVQRYFQILRTVTLTSSKCASLRKKAGLASATFYSIG